MRHTSSESEEVMQYSDELLISGGNNGATQLIMK